MSCILTYKFFTYLNPQFIKKTYLQMAVPFDTSKDAMQVYGLLPSFWQTAKCKTQPQNKVLVLCVTNFTRLDEYLTQAKITTTCPMWKVTCHISHVMCQMSNIDIFFTKQETWLCQTHLDDFLFKILTILDHIRQ